MNNFVIVGCQRSGTTLVELIMNSHYDMLVIGENRAYNLLEMEDKPGNSVRSFYMDRAIKEIKKYQVNNVGYRIPVWTYNYEVLKEKLPGVKTLFVFRDLKPIVASMLTLGDWINNCAGEIERSLTGITDDKVKEFFAQKNKEARGNNLFYASLCAFIKQYLFVEYEKAGMPVHKVIYEDLVSNPKETIYKILTFLDVPWDDRCMQHHKIHDFQYNGTINSGTNPERSIDKKSLKKWKDILSDEDVKIIDEYVKVLEKEIP